MNELTNDITSENSLGNFLQQERLKKNVSIEDVAEATCIHIATLRAIEAGDREKIPAEVFARGFVKLYAEYLGLDTQDVLNRYNSELVTLGQKGDRQELISGKSLGHEAPFFSTRRIILLILIIVLLALGYYFWWSGNEFPFPRKSRAVYFEKYYVDSNPPLYAAQKKQSTIGKGSEGSSSTP
jgi:cytoskeletal protein RodZ